MISKHENLGSQVKNLQKVMECSKLSHKTNGADENWKRIVLRAFFHDAGNSWKQGLLFFGFLSHRFLVHSWHFCAFLMGIKGKGKGGPTLHESRTRSKTEKLEGKEIPMDMFAEGAKISKLALFRRHARSPPEIYFCIQSRKPNASLFSETFSLAFLE